jgi:hypothetical protein
LAGSKDVNRLRQSSSNGDGENYRRAQGALRKATAGSLQRHKVTEKCERFKTEGTEKNGGQRESAELLRMTRRWRALTLSAQSRPGDVRNANREIGIPIEPLQGQLQKAGGTPALRWLFLGLVVFGWGRCVCWERDCFARRSAVGGGAEILDGPAYWEAQVAGYC